MGRLKDAFMVTTGTDDKCFRAMLDLYESEMRPKEAAPVMWRRGCPPPSFGDIYTDGKVIDTNEFAGCTHHITLEDLLERIPFPADPTPEEKAEAEFEDVWNQDRPITSEISVKDEAKRYYIKGFMAAKFPEEGGGKP